jgi:hypothetical protein
VKAAAGAILNSTLRRNLRALALALLLQLASASLPLAAQAIQEPPQQPTSQPEQQSEQTEEPASTATPQAQQPGVDESAATTPEDPFDYEASEQISEDLSVSFPVDI